MIDTIFYFANTDNEYQAKLASGEISDKTIAFVKDTNKIYINGHDYVGRVDLQGWLTDVIARIRNIVDQISENNDLMAASLSLQLKEAVDDLEVSIREARQAAADTSTELTLFKSTIGEETDGAILAAINDAMNHNGQNIWTEVNRANEGVSTITTRLNTSMDSSGNIRYTSALQSILDVGIDNNEAITNIAQRYAVLDENQEILEWLSSGFKSKTGDNETFAAMYSAAESATQDAIAQAKTDVLKDVNDNYVATATLASLVTNIVNDNLQTSLSDIALKSDVDSASATMQASYTSQQTQIDGLQSQIDNLNTQLSNARNAIAQVSTKADENRARAELLTALDDNGAAIINESKLDSAVSRIIANSGSAASAITVIANEQAGYAKADMTTQLNNALSSYAQTTDLNSVETSILNYLKDSQGNPIRSADIVATVNNQGSQISAIAKDVEGASAAMLAKADLDSAIVSLLSENENSGTLSNITAIADDKIAGINLESRLQDAISTARAGLATNTSVGNAITELGSYIEDGDGNKITSASIKAQADANAARISTLATNINSLTNAGFIAEAGLDDAVAQVIANAGDTSAAITQIADSSANNVQTTIENKLKDSSGNPIAFADLKLSVDNNTSEISALSSSVSDMKSGMITEANIDSAVASLFAANADNTAKANISAMVLQGINGLDFSTIELSANQIKLSGHTLADHIEATSGTIGSFNIDSAKLSATVSGNKIDISPSTISTYLDSTVTNLINTDGTGMLAKGGISWDANGNLTLSLKFLESLFAALHNGAVMNSLYAGINETFTIYRSLYTNSTHNTYWDNADLLYSEISLFPSSTKYLDRIIDHRSSSTQNYPFTGTVLQKRDWFFLRYDIVGEFVSGILTSKYNVDPETKKRKEEISELYIDHTIYIRHVPTLAELAQANGLEINKCLGVSNSARLLFDSEESTSSSDTDWSVIKRNDDTYVKLVGFSGFDSDSMLENPQDGNWAIISSNYFSVTNEYSGNVGFVNEPNLIAELVPERDTFGVSGFLAKYTNGAWTIISNPTTLLETETQYRGDESE